MIFKNLEILLDHVIEVDDATFVTKSLSILLMLLQHNVSLMIHNDQMKHNQL